MKVFVPGGKDPIYGIKRVDANNLEACLYTPEMGAVDCGATLAATPTDDEWHVVLASYKTYFDPSDYTKSGIKWVLHLDGTASNVYT